MTITETPGTTDTAAGLDKVRQWADDYAARLTAGSNARLARAAHPNGGNGQFSPAIGEPTIGSYVGFDVAMTSPIQPAGLPPYQPSKVIAAGEPAFIVVFTWINPTPVVPSGFAVPPTVQLGGRSWRLSLDLTDMTSLTPQTLVQTGTYGAPAPAVTVEVFTLPTPSPGPDPAVYEANVTFDITDPGQPYAAFATSFFDVDADPGFLFVPPAAPQWRNDQPNRYIVYKN
jgi:hypothetical protein